MVLIINKQKVERLSGPVSVTILKPKNTFYQRYKTDDNHIPIFILFGDIHFSGKNGCKVMDENDYNIYDSEFLKLFDRTATKSFPVDFYVEAFLHNERSFPYVTEREPMNLFLKKIHPCYGKRKSSKRITESIRWQSADIRRAPTDEHQYNFETFIDKFSEVIEEFSKRNYFTPRIVKSIIKKNITNNYSRGQIIEYLDICKMGLRSKKFASALVSHPKSLIMKQANKIKNGMWDTWIKDYVEYNIKNKVRYLPKKSTIDVDVPTILYNYFYNGADDKYIQQLTKYIIRHENQLEDYEMDFLEFNCIFLDLYMITRSFKPPRNDINPFISIGYFGRDHCSGISYFLKHIMKGYSTVYYKDNGDAYEKNDLDEDEVNRCLEFKKDVNLDSLMKGYGYKNRK